jgi:hypothetical protein
VANVTPSEAVPLPLTLKPVGMLSDGYPPPPPPPVATRAPPTIDRPLPSVNTCGAPVPLSRPRIPAVIVSPLEPIAPGCTADAANAPCAAVA